MKEYEKAINNSEEYAEAGKGWGVDFNGDFIFVVENLPLDKVSIDDIPEDLKEQLDEYVPEGTGYAFLGLKDGKCTGAELVKGLDEKEHGFELIAPYENWKNLMKGEMEVVQGIMRGDFKLNGDMAKIMQYTRAAQILAGLAGEIPGVDFIDEKYAK